MASCTWSPAMDRSTRSRQADQATRSNFATRVGTDDTIAFANAVLASDQLGSPLGGILRAQASDLVKRLEQVDADTTDETHRARSMGDLATALQRR